MREWSYELCEWSLYTGEMGSWLMADVKLLEFPSGGRDVRFDIADKTRHFALQVLHNIFNFVVVAFHDQLDPAIRQIADVAVDVVLLCNIVGGITESDPLNMAAEVEDVPLHPRMPSLMRVLKTAGA
jgi:hypothetical protein